ncbi:MAG: YitT family protein [Bacteroidales bacterium]|nr:YitT family protein [Bacteroidales bacterium]
MGARSHKPKSSLLSVLEDYAVITLGVFLYTFSWADMLIPNGIASGGLTGACTILNFATGIPVYLSYIVVNAMLILLGTLVLGKGFGFKTLFAIGLSTIGLDFLSGMEFLHVFFDNKLLLVVVAAIIESIGITFILARGGSTGGTDIVALIVNKFWPVSLGKVFLAVDLFIIASVLLIPGKTVEDMVYGYVAMVIFSVFVDWVLLGRNSTWQIMVFSDKYKEIADTVIHDLNRGVTALDAQGWYSGQSKKVLLIMVRKPELHTITRTVKEIDPRAFVTVSSASTVYGEGFDEMKTGINLKLKKKSDNVNNQTEEHPSDN